MTIRTTLITSSLIAASLISGAAHAALIGRDLNGSASSFEAYYDTDLDITWLADANYAKTSGHDGDGRMSWAAAMTWADALSFTDGSNIYDNWRLPITRQPDSSCDAQSRGFGYGENCTGSEMGHLFYVELGGTAGQPITTSTDPDLAKFTNFQYWTYWSATSFQPDTGDAWLFGYSDGYQLVSGKDDKDDGFNALAVSPGDVGRTNDVPDPNVVPEPATLALLGLGLLGLAVARRRG